MSMKWTLYYQFWQIRRAASPSASFSARLESDLKQRTGHMMWWIPIGRIAVGLVSVSILVSGATGVYAYNSDTVTLGHPLYGVRNMLEQVELKTALQAKNRENILQKHRLRHERSIRRLQK